MGTLAARQPVSVCCLEFQRTDEGSILGAQLSHQLSSVSSACKTPLKSKSGLARGQSIGGPPFEPLQARLLHSTSESLRVNSQSPSENWVFFNHTSVSILIVERRSTMLWLMLFSCYRQRMKV